jgi:hypothetical protein
MAIPESSNPNTATTMNQSGMGVTFLDSASFWANIAVVAFGVLAAIAGVFALYFSFRLGAVKDAELERFQTESKVAISLAEARAAEANEKSAGAAEGTARALANAAEANKLAESFRLDIANANERAASANVIAEKERLARLKLEEAVAPRRLVPEQKERFRQLLAKHATPFPVRIMVFIGTEDGIPFSLDILESLKAAGWNAEHTGQGTMGGQLRGVSLFVKDTTKPPVHAAVLRQAFKQIGIDAEGVMDPSQPEDQVTIFVAPKR